MAQSVIFDVRLDNTDFIAKMNAVKTAVSTTNDAVKQTKLVYDLDTSTVENKIAGLRSTIGILSDQIQKGESELAGLVGRIKEAVASGDDATFDRLSSDAEALSGTLSSSRADLEAYTVALRTLEEASGMTATSISDVKAPALYTEDQYARVQDLSKRIKEINNERVIVDIDPSRLEELDNELMGTTDELRGLQSEAVAAAAALGSKLGGKAGDASVRLYELNAAVETQTKTVADLQSQADKAAAAFEAAKQSGNATEVANTRAQYEYLRDALANATAELNRLRGAQTDARMEWANVSAEVDKANSVIVRMCGGQEKYNQIVSVLPGPLKNVITGIQGVTSASLKFIATPIGAVIMAIVLAFEALQSYFTSSAEGQLQFAEASGYLSGVLGQLKEIVIAAGKAIYDYYRTMGNAFRAAWNLMSGDLDGAKQAFEDLKQSAKDCADSVVAAAKQVGTSFSNMDAAGKAQGAIDRRRKELDLIEAQWGTQELRNEKTGDVYRSRVDLDKAVANAQLKMYDQSLSASAQKKAAAEYKAALKERYEAERYFTDERLKLKQEEARWTTNPLETDQELAKLREEDAQKEVEYTRQLAALRRRENRVDSRAEQGESREVAAAKKADAAEAKALREARALKDLEYQAEDARIAAMRDGEEKILAQMRLNHDRELEELDRQRQDYLQRKIDTARAEFEADQTNKGKVFDKSTIALSPEEEAEFDRVLEAVKARQEKESEDLYRAQMQSMYNYLKEYGTLQQQKLAIAQEYSRKISEAENEWQRKSLEKERDNAVASIDARSIASEIDWSLAFEGVGNVLGDIARETLAKVEDYMRTEEFNALSADNKKSYVDLRNKLKQETGGGASSPFALGQWSKIADQTKAYQNSVRDMQTANEAHARAVNAYIAAQERLKNATDDTERSMAQSALDIAKSGVDATAVAVTEAQADMRNRQSELKDSTEGAAQGLQNFASYLSEINSGSLYGFANGMSKLITSLIKGGDGVGKALGELGGKIGGLVGAILQILDALGDDPSGFITGVLDSVFGAISRLLEQVFTGELVTGVFKSLFNGVGSIFSGLFGSSNASEVKRTTETLTRRNEALTRAIEQLTDTIKSAKGVESVNAYQRAYDMQKERISNQGNILAAQQRLNGSHHSNNYYINRAMTSADWAQINSFLGLSGGDRKLAASELWSLTPEQLASLQSLPEIWSKIYNSGKYDKKEFIDDYIALADTLGSLTDDLNEALTQTTFDGFYGNFVSMLMDMESDVDSFADDISQQLAKSFLANEIGARFQDRLRNWYDTWAEDMRDGALSQDEIGLLKSQYDQFVKEAIAERDRIAAITGYTGSASTTSQTATSKGYQTVSEDTMTEANGRMSALYICGEAIRDGQSGIADDIRNGMQILHTVLLTATEGNDTLNAILLQHVTSNAHLADIVEYQKKICDSVGEDLHRSITELSKKVA